MIGGPHAVRILTDFQKPDLPPAIRERAGWYLNQLGDRVVDFMFGSQESAPASLEEVAVRDSLGTPYRWMEASAALTAFLEGLCRDAWPRLRSAVEAVIPAGVLNPSRLEQKRVPETGGEGLDDEYDVWDSLTLAAVIRFSNARLLVLDGTLTLFPEQDVRSRQECKAPSGWWAALLDPSAPSALYLDRLPLLRAPANSEAWEASRSGNLGSADLHGLFRSWVNQLPVLAQHFNRRDARWLALALAILHDRVHEEMHWPRPPLPQTLHTWLAPYPKESAARE
jgi:hypothetical protein